MSCDAVLLMVFLTVAFRQAFGNQCIFSTAIYVKAPPSVVTESTVISNFEHDCEFHCYTNPSRCIAANVVPLPNGTYQCEFVSVKVTPDYRAVLEPNPGGKYIYVAAVVSQEVNVARQSMGAACDDFDGRDCSGVFSDVGFGWDGQQQQTGTWLEIRMPVFRLVTSINLQPRCSRDQDFVHYATLNFGSGGRATTRFPCSPSCSTLPGKVIPIGPVIIDSVRITVTGTCSFKTEIAFQQVEIAALVFEPL